MAHSKEELPIHREMFRYYYKLGLKPPYKRDVNKVAAKFSKKVGYVNSARKNFNWPEKVKAMDGKASERFHKNLEKEIEKADMDFLDIARAHRIKFAQKLKDGTLSVTEMGLIAFMKHIRLIAGRSTENVQNLTLLDLIKESHESESDNSDQEQNL